MKNKSFLFTILAVLGLMQTAQAFDLPEAWRAARTHSADYRAADFNRDAEVEREKQSKAALLPQVSAHASYQYQPPSLSSTKTTRSRNIQLNQTIYDGTKWAQYRQSKLNTQAAESRLSHEQADMMLKVSESYFNVLLAKDTIRAVESEREAYRQQMEQANQMFQVGVATAVDIHEAQAGYDAAVAKSIDALMQKQMAENLLADYTGYDSVEIKPVSVENLVARIEPQVKKRSLSDWQNLALQHNHEYQTQKLTANMAQEGINMAKANRLPKVNATVGYQHNRYRGTQNEVDYNQTGKGLSASINLSVPLFTSGEIRSQVREAAARVGEAESKLLGIERKVKLAVKQAFTENNAIRYQILAQERLLASSRLKLKSTRTGKDFGVRSNLEVMQAQQQFADAEQKLAQARYRYLQSYLALVKESGMSLEKAWAATQPSEAAVKTVPTSEKNQGKRLGTKKRQKRV